MKAAWIAVTGEERKKALARLEVIADTFLSMNAPVQWALPAWLTGPAAIWPAIQEQIRKRVAANLAVLDRNLDRGLEAVKGVQRLTVEGGWYAVLRAPAMRPTSRRFWPCWSAEPGCIRATFSGCRSRAGSW